jgi:transcriptional regulator with XRE-family HTH domain
MLTIEQIKEKMKDRKISSVASACGISRQGLHQLLKDKNKPSYDILERLTKYFELKP